VDKETANHAAILLREPRGHCWANVKADNGPFSSGCAVTFSKWIVPVRSYKRGPKQSIKSKNKKAHMHSPPTTMWCAARDNGSRQPPRSQPRDAVSLEAVPGRHRSCALVRPDSRPAGTRRVHAPAGRCPHTAARGTVGGDNTARDP
jgi:hypothetical protein